MRAPSRFGAVRYEDGEFNMRCESCREYWPIDLEFWVPDYGLTKCKACHSEIRARRRLETRRAQEQAERKRERDRLYYARMMADPDGRALLRARRRAASRRYYERKRLEILDRRRAAYAESLDRPINVRLGRPRVAA